MNTFPLLTLAALVVAVCQNRAQQTTNRAILDSSFNLTEKIDPFSLAIQPDGKILIAQGMPSGFNGPDIARFHPDGTLDESFHPPAFKPSVYNHGDTGTAIPSYVESVALQPDGKILIGGFFTLLGENPRTNLARLNPDGSQDIGFRTPDVGEVRSLLLQPDGKILIAGDLNLQAPGTDFEDSLARLNPDGSLDDGFTPGAGRGYYPGAICMALLQNGKIVVGGGFNSLTEGSSLDGLALLNPDGTLDRALNAGTGYCEVRCLGIQADGKIVVGGEFSRLQGHSSTNLARLTADGSFDSTFEPPLVNGPVLFLGEQADGKLLFSGEFFFAGDLQATIGRLNLDGTLDATFNPKTDDYVPYFAIQADGKVLVPLGNSIARFTNTQPAAQNLSLDGSIITWLRGGTSPEVWRTTFESSKDNVLWIPLGEGQRVSGGWQITNVFVPNGASIRARGFVSNSGVGGGMVETSLMLLPQISTASLSSTGFGFEVIAPIGEVVVVERSLDLLNWLPFQTNTLVSGTIRFNDPHWQSRPQQFYRARLP